MRQNKKALTSFLESETVELKPLSRGAPRVEYSLSELGDSMRPIIKAMEVWVKNYQQMVKQQNKPTTTNSAQPIKG